MATRAVLPDFAWKRGSTGSETQTMQGPLVAIGQVHGGTRAQGVAASFDFVRKSDGYKIGDRKNYIGEITAQGEINGAKFESKGSAMFIHAHSANIMPYNVGAEWNMIFVVGHPESMPKDKRNAESASTYHVLQYETLKSYGSVHCSNAGLTQENKLKAVHWDTKVEHHEMTKDENGSGYDIPKHLVFTSMGKTVDSKKARVVFDARPIQRLHDMLFD
ncbi:putative cell survival pathways protein [Coemansia sp. RSA 1972]|nr:putative cell survival pathways protein [Coemansia sp. RSA 1972]